ncbi:MAG: hypothetical protein PVF30_07905, partial [Desulfobacterales bacterium]
RIMIIICSELFTRVSAKTTSFQHAFVSEKKQVFILDTANWCILPCRVQKDGLKVTGGVGYVRDIAGAFCGAHREIGRCLLNVSHSYQ